jgi:hypothetical protein
LQEEHGQKPLELILNLEGVNWHESKFGNSQKPIPVLQKDSKQYELIARELAELSSEPVGKETLAGMLYGLQGHYWVAGMPENVAKAVAMDYLRLLLPCGYSQKAVQMACDSWLRNPANRFFPKIGEIEELIKAQEGAIKWRKLRLTKLRDKAV